MTKLFFKVCRGYGEDHVSIGEEDLDRAIYAQLTGAVFLSDGGTIAGNRIEMIVPDWNRIVGFSPGRRMDSEDWAEIKRNHGDIRKLCSAKLWSATDRVKKEIGGVKVEMMRQLK